MSIFEKPNPIPDEAVMALGLVIGSGMAQCREILEKASPLFYERLVEAATTQNVDVWNDRLGKFAPPDYFELHDPLEDKPEFAEAFQRANQLAKAAIKAESSMPRRFGAPHRFWHVKRQFLREQYGIEWFSPDELNPHILFD